MVWSFSSNFPLRICPSFVMQPAADRVDSISRDGRRWAFKWKLFLKLTHLHTLSKRWDARQQQQQQQLQLFRLEWIPHFKRLRRKRFTIQGVRLKRMERLELG